MAFRCCSRISFIICSCRALRRAFLSCFTVSLSPKFPSGRSLSLEEEGSDPSLANAPVRCAMSLYVCTSRRHKLSFFRMRFATFIAVRRKMSSFDFIFFSLVARRYTASQNVEPFLSVLAAWFSLSKWRPFFSTLLSKDPNYPNLARYNMVFQSFRC